MPLAFALVAVLAPAGVDSVGVVWSEATVDPQARQRVLAAVVAAAGSGTQIVDNADLAARLLIAYEVELAVVERQRGRLEMLEVAEAAYRRGDPEAARTGTEVVLAGVREEPHAPGVVALLVRAHLLRAQILWTEGDAAQTDAELLAALALDPDARITTRRMPPDLVARHGALADAMLAARGSWVAPNVTVGNDAVLELDGRPGSRPVPPGHHVIVLRRPGAVPVAAFVDSEWAPPARDERLSQGLPMDAVHAERICGALALRAVVLVRMRRGRAGVQHYECGAGFANAWYGSATDLDAGVRVATAAKSVAGGGIQVLGDDGAWPVVRASVGVVRDPRVDEPVARPWWRKGWVWGLVGAVVVGGIVTGAVLGTRGSPGGYVVDADSFLGD